MSQSISKTFIATEQKFPYVSTENETITEVECEPFRLAFSWQPLYFGKLVLVALKYDS